jgi:hypothetical protein
MSIPLVQKADKDAINTSIIAIKRNIERINMLLGLVDSGSPDLSGLATKQELEDTVTEINNTIDEVETSLQPVDTVTSGNMHSVTSNAVFKNKVKVQSIFKTYNNCAPNTDVPITDYPLITDVPNATEMIHFTGSSIRPLDSWAQCPVQLYVNASHNGWIIRSLGSYSGSFEVQWDVYYI